MVANTAKHVAAVANATTISFCQRRSENAREWPG